MNVVTLKTDGSIHLNGTAVDCERLDLLCCQIAVEEVYTLRSFFKMMDQYALYAKLNVFIPSYTEQVRSCPKEGCDNGLLDYLEFSKTVEMIGVPEKRLEIYNSLSGVSANETSAIKSMQLAGLLDVPLRLGKLKHVVFGDRVDIFEFDTVYTLFEFIDGIAWQLSFHATPEHCQLRR
ncbi:MAG: hypothetical protein PVF24_09665 [Desulfobacterales bacterium]|jgi:hypothetical protein